MHLIVYLNLQMAAAKAAPIVTQMFTQVAAVSNSESKFPRREEGK